MKATFSEESKGNNPNFLLAVRRFIPQKHYVAASSNRFS
jgi:hypothetical protein